jgi:glyoxylase-like metal-dependent hydrolase (beta-lactamase superfamily II)
MFFTLDVRRARKGDCLLLHWGTKKQPGLGLIDGGPPNVYKPQLKPRLEEIRQARGLDDDASLPVDFLMVSHIDDDHINGVLELTKELLEAKQSQEPLALKINGLWHNSFDDIIGNSPKELTAAFTASFGEASLSRDPNPEDLNGLDPDVAKVLSSVDQGFRLRDDGRGLKLRVNPQFAGKLVLAKAKGKKIDMGNGLSFTVLGPMNPEVVALQKAHDDFLKSAAKKGKKTEAALAAFTDTSVPNLSSLVVLAEAGKKRILLTGDARGDKILEGLELVGLLKKDGKSTIHVDVLKCPHHGSDRNVDPIFFRRITADHYVFSGNGQHGNPERATLQMLLDERGDEDYTIHLTYPIDEIDVERKAEAKKHGKSWSVKKQSLASFFADNKAFAKKVVIVTENEPHLINLLDEM